MAVLVISYSRADRSIVREIADLLTAALEIEKAVFWDSHLRAGEPWFEQIVAQLDQGASLFVFWCHHSVLSDQVKREYRCALSKLNRVVPVLLDDTPRPQELSRLHPVDLRASVRHRKARLGTARRRTKAGDGGGNIERESRPPSPPVAPIFPSLEARRQAHREFATFLRKPTKTKDVRPVYPPIAQSARIQGVVIVEATIGPEGRVVEARILRSLPLLDAAALAAVRQWEYAPTEVDGIAVPVITTVTVMFTLQ